MIDKVLVVTELLILATLALGNYLTARSETLETPLATPETVATPKVSKNNGSLYVGIDGTVGTAASVTRKLKKQGLAKTAKRKLSPVEVNAYLALGEGR